jgi:hypothetical protein
MAGNEEWFHAGCRLFRSRAEALAHWSNPRYWASRPWRTPERCAARQKRAAAYVAAIKATPMPDPR